MNTFIERLRAISKAYPEDVFGPVLPEEIAAYPNLITRNSAAMGRHLSTFISEAADVIEELSGALEMVRDADDDCRRDGLQTIPETARARIDAALIRSELGAAVAPDTGQGV